MANEAQATLDRLETRLQKNLRKQVQNGLAEIFTLSSCNAVGREIKAGRKVTENAEFGIRVCVHPKVGPRYNPSTKKFFPQTAKGKRLEEAFIEKTNLMLETGGFRKMSPNLLSSMRKGDKEFAQEVKRR